MVSHSTITKMKAFLVIDVLIVAAAAGIYIYYQNQGEFTTIALTPATFEVTNLSINPSEVNVGQAVVISVNVTNVGDEAGTYSFSPEINGVLLSENKTVELNARETTTVEFAVVQPNPGTYTVKIGELTGTFTIATASPSGGPSGGKPASITGYNLNISPEEVWPGQQVTISGFFTNYGDVSGHSVVSLKIGGTTTDSTDIELDGGASRKVEFTYTAESAGTFAVKLGVLSGTLYVVPSGTHTLTVRIIPAGDADFFLDGAPHKTPYSAILNTGSHTVSLPVTDPTGKVVFLNWEDYSKNPTRTINLQKRMTVTAYYSGGSSCPSLYTWNGNEYVYVSEVSNHGWLGYINYKNSSNGDVPFTFYRNNPWDYIPLNKNQLQPINNAYNLTLTQRWNEIFYVDQAYMVVVDHPADVNVYSTMVEQYLDPNYMGQIYAVSKNPLTPVSAINENGQNVLPQISQIDDVFTPGIDGLNSPSWDNIQWNQLTMNLGNLSSASQIKLVVRAIVDFGSPDDYNTWLGNFFDPSVPDGAEVTPPPFMQVKAANGSWVNVPWSRQFPIPSDAVPRTFVVDLTGLFPTSDYSLRISNFWNVTFDYIGVDTTSNSNVTVQKINPYADLHQVFNTVSASSGNFTKYGDVTQLLQTEDDEFVIGRQGDEITLQFPTDNLTAPAEGMVRDYYFFVSCWFKDENGNWGFGFGFTADPLPFHTMSGFPYPPPETYPTDAEHLNYLAEWNTRIIAAQ